MNLNITIDPACNDTVKAGAVEWINSAAKWSSRQYDKVDLEVGTTWSIEPYEFNVVTIQVQHRPVPIQMSEVDHVNWSPEVQKAEWFKSQSFYTGFQVGIEAAAIGLMRTCKHVLAKDINDDQYRENWDADVTPEEERLLYLQETYPELIKSWTDRSGWLSNHVKNLNPEHWRFPALNPKLCRSGSWGSGAVFPPNSGRS
jgi:hypothetical protein